MISLLLSSSPPQQPSQRHHHHHQQQQQRCHHYYHHRRCYYSLPLMWNIIIIIIILSAMMINVSLPMVSIVGVVAHSEQRHDTNRSSSDRLLRHRRRQLVVGMDNTKNDGTTTTQLPFQSRLSSILQQRLTFPGTFHLVKANQKNVKLSELKVGPKFHNGDIINIELYGGHSYQYSLYIDNNVPYAYVTFSYDTPYRNNLVYNDSHIPYSMSSHDDSNRYEPVNMLNKSGNYTIFVTGYSQGGDAVVASMNLSFSIIHDARAARISSTSSSTAKNRSIQKPNHPK